MRSHFKYRLLTLLVAAAPLAVAASETKPYAECTNKAPADADVAAAKGAFQAGNAAFNEGDYPRAITYWEDAFRRDCTASALLKNLARAYELGGNKEQAIVCLETFVSRNPESGEKEQIQGRIARLREQIQAEKAAVPTGTAPASSATAAPTGSSEIEPPHGKKPMLPLIVAGGGAAVGVLGMALYFPAKADVADVEEQCGGSRNCRGDSTLAEKGNSARSKQNLGGALTLVGLVAAVGGLTWYFLSPEEPPAAAARRPIVVPAVTPGFAGVSFSGAF